ncbi:hypothetical protein Desti_4595 [Desulfomonile tiedjei DSM 6799]|uniref:Uncharacterized protein n=1 Tax=Desulfomonile tiedjei (strain ATCC 49306 / DSM 6799 / DCB-1) TaxID=706587 RepID=I4CCD0_DESTA|nr:hypothetical protein Desti_4595 [Desulfomonile tiedjei DSM 6799]
MYPSFIVSAKNSVVYPSCELQDIGRDRRPCRSILSISLIILKMCRHGGTAPTNIPNLQSVTNFGNLYDRYKVLLFSEIVTGFTMNRRVQALLFLISRNTHVQE